jgi:osmotically-inducible protein OsmY
MIGGGFGGYTGGGYQGYEPGGEPDRGRGQGGWSGYGGGNYGRGRFGSERDYESGPGYSGREEERGGHEDRGFFERIGDEVSSWFGGDEHDENRRRSHRGRGPRNYTRSDDTILDEVNDRLTDSHFIDASDIEVDVSSGDVILTGNVDSRYAKRMAEDIAESVSGVKNVENRIRVNKNWGQPYSQTATGSTQTSSSGDADMAAGSGTPGRTGTSGPITGTGTTSGKSRGKAAGSSD